MAGAKPLDPDPEAAPVAEPVPAWKRVALSYRTPAAIGLVLLIPHAWWFTRCAADTRGEPVAGFGALMIVLGLLVAARPFIAAGARATARQSIPEPYIGPFAMPAGSTRRTQERHERRIDAAVPGVIAERVVAVAVVGVGPLVNGYSAPIARGMASVLGFSP